MKRNFSIRLDDALLERIKRISDSYDMKPARIIEHALRIYVGLVEQNDGAMLSPLQVAEFTKIISGELGQSHGRDIFSEIFPSSLPHEPGKAINPAAAGGAGTAPQSASHENTQQKSSS